MPPKILFLLGFLLVISCTDSLAQEDEYVLVLRKNPKGKRIQFEVKDVIKFQYHDSIFQDTITNIDASRIQLRYYSWYELDAIQKIYDIDGRSFFINGAVKFPIAGALFFSITTLNQGLNQGKPLVLREHLIPSLILISMGAIMYPFRYQHHKLKNKWELIAIPS